MRHADWSYRSDVPRSVGTDSGIGRPHGFRGSSNAVLRVGEDIHVFCWLRDDAIGDERTTTAACEAVVLGNPQNNSSDLGLKQFAHGRHAAAVARSWG